MCGVGAKFVAHLMKFHLLQWEVVKAKFLMNSNMILTVLNQIKSRSNQGHTMMFAHLQPLTNVPTKYQLPTPYGFRDTARTRFYRSRSLQQGQRSNQGQTMTLHTYIS